MILDVNNTYIILRFKTSFSVQWLRLHVSNGHVWTVIHNDRKKSSFQDVVFLKCQTGASVHSVMFIVASLLCVICYSEWTLECGVWTPRCWRTLVMKQSGHPDADRHSWWNSLDTQMLTNTRDETFWTPRCWRTLMMKVWTPRCWQTLMMKQSGHPDADEHSWWNSLDTQMLTNTRDETVWTPRCWQTPVMKHSGHPDADQHSWWNILPLGYFVIYDLSSYKNCSGCLLKCSELFRGICFALCLCEINYGHPIDSMMASSIVWARLWI